MLILASISSIPVWLVTSFPSADGPIHLYIGYVSSHYDAPGADLLRQYFELNPRTEPNATVYFLISLLLQYFDPAIAEKIIISFFCFATAGATYYAILGICRRATVMSIFGLLIVFNFHLHSGFYNFSLSLAAFLVTLGYWLRHDEQPKLLHLITVGLLSLALVYTHLFGFAVFAIVAAVASPLTWVLSRRDAGLRASLPWRVIVGRSLGLGLALLPAAIVVVDFLWRYPTGERTVYGLSVLDLMVRLVAMSFLATYERWEAAIVVPVLILLVILLPPAWRATVARPRAVGLLAAMLVLITLYLFWPMTVRDVYVGERFQPFILLVGVLWLSSCYDARYRLRYDLVALAAVLAVLAGTAYRTSRYLAVDDDLAEYMSVAPAVAPGHTLLSLDLDLFHLPSDPTSKLRVDPLRHAGARVALLRDGVDLKGALLSTHVYGYFPIHYREALDPYVHLGPRIDELIDALEVDLSGFGAGSEGRVDYVLLWPVTPTVERAPSYRAIAAQLATGYDLICVSKPRQLAQLYGRRDLAASSAPVECP